MSQGADAIFKNNPEDRDGVCAILDKLNGEAQKSQDITVSQIVERFGGRGFGPFLLLPALIEISPVGGIPGLPTALAAIIIIVAAQIIIGREHLWLPEFINRRSVSSNKVRKAVGKLRPLARWLDRWFHGRLPLLVSAPFVKVAAVVVILNCVSVPFLEIIPFASTIPMAVVIAFGLAMTVRDGVLMAMAFVGTVAGAGGLWLLAR